MDKKLDSSSDPYGLLKPKSKAPAPGSGLFSSSLQNGSGTNKSSSADSFENIQTSFSGPGVFSGFLNTPNNLASKTNMMPFVGSNMTSAAKQGVQIKEPSTTSNKGSAVTQPTSTGNEVMNVFRPYSPVSNKQSGNLSFPSLFPTMKEEEKTTKKTKNQPTKQTSSTSDSSVYARHFT
jgi:hypothetical protein